MPCDPSSAGLRCSCIMTGIAHLRERHRGGGALAAIALQLLGVGERALCRRGVAVGEQGHALAQLHHLLIRRDFLRGSQQAVGLVDGLRLCRRAVCSPRALDAQLR